MGKTNKLLRYVNQDITIRIPGDDKKISSLKWLSIWDIRDNQNFADIFIPEGFEPPSPQKISEFSRDSHSVKSGPLVIMDSKRIKINDLVYDGLSSSAYFLVGTGPQPNPSGKKIPNELGYLESLGSYSAETIVLDLPGDLTIFDIDWISIWDEETQESFGFVSIPEGLNIPPSLSVVKKKETSRLPNCEQLHTKLQLSWEIFGPQMTFEVSGQISANDYIAFGLSGSKTKSQMIGSDVAISYLDGHIGFTQDYNITGHHPCTNILGHFSGVCTDSKLGGIENFQILTFFREDDVTRITFRRNLISGDEGDVNLSKDEPQYVVWSIGRLNSLKEPRIHSIYPKRNVKIHFGRKPEKNCFPFTQLIPDDSSDVQVTKPQSLESKPWGPLRIMNQTITTYYARLGVAGGSRGYTSSTDGQGSPGYVWYINGLMAPVIFVRRGVEYYFRVEGGNDPSNGAFYHPLYITDDPNGGYIKHSDAERKKYHIYAGIELDRKNRPNPTAAGRLCLWSYDKSADPRKSDTFTTFNQFRSSLNYTCQTKGSAATLKWTPSLTTPDVVYYQSYTQRNMGWKIIVLDDFSPQATSSGTSCLPKFRNESLLLSLLIIILTKFSNQSV